MTSRNVPSESEQTYARETTRATLFGMLLSWMKPGPTTTLNTTYLKPASCTGGVENQAQLRGNWADLDVGGLGTS